MNKKFAESTKKMLKLLPYWFKMKKDPYNSIGAQFLDVFGMSLDDVETLLEFAYKQTHLLTADENFIDIVYKGVVPEYLINNIEEYTVIGSDRNLKSATTVSDFIIRPYDDLGHPTTNVDDVFFIDIKEYTIYVNEPYGATKSQPKGKIIFSKGNEWIEIPLSIHMIWNYFDEFGYLLGCPRIVGEKNVQYKERILDVFKNPANATKDGLLNGIARELGIRKIKLWTDQDSEFEIRDPMVVLNKIKINGQYVKQERIVLTDRNTVIIKNDGTIKPQEVSYVSGIELHALNNRKDYSLIRQLYMANGTASELLEKYANIIGSLVPIMWGQFAFNEGYWDVANENMSGFAALPHIADANYGNFRWYDIANPKKSVMPKLLDIIVNDINVSLNAPDIKIKYSTLLDSISLYPSEITVSRGDIIGFDYSYGKNG